MEKAPWRTKEFNAYLRELERRRTKEDMFLMAKFVLGRHWMKPGEASKWDMEKHPALSKQLMTLWRTRKQRGKTIMKVRWPRRTLKSTICTGAFPVWVLLNYPNTRILINSYNEENAINFLQPIKMAFESAYFRETFGDLRDLKNWTKEAITVKRDAVFPQASVTCSGLQKEKTSQHYDLIIDDDSQTHENSQSPLAMQDVIDNYRLYENVLDPHGMLVMPLTPWNFNDLDAFIEEEAKEEFESGRPQRIFTSNFSCYKTDEKGNFTKELEFPNILTQEELNAARAKQGAFIFSCQFLTRPASDETATFKYEWMKERFHKRVKEDFEGCPIYMAWDPAGEGTFKSADANALIVAAIDYRFDIYVLHTMNMRGTREKVFAKVVELYEFYQPTKIGIETSFFQGQLKKWFLQENNRKIPEAKFYDFKTTGRAKPNRIQALQPYFESGKIWLRREQTELIDQLLKYSPTAKNAFDDLVDALAYVLEFMRKPVADQPKEFWSHEGWAEEWEKKHPEQPMPDENDVRVWEANKREKEGRRETKVFHLFRVN